MMGLMGLIRPMGPITIFALWALLALSGPSQKFTGIKKDTREQDLGPHPTPPKIHRQNGLQENSYCRGNFVPNKKVAPEFTEVNEEVTFEIWCKIHRQDGFSTDFQIEEAPRKSRSLSL